MNEVNTHRSNLTKNATTGARGHALPPGNIHVASHNHTESRYSNVDTMDALTYSASAVSDASELRSKINQSAISNRFVDVIPNEQPPKIESKDHMWKPAPIMGRNFQQREINEPVVNK